MRLCLVCFCVTERQYDFCRLQLLQLRMKWSGKTLSGFSCPYILWLSVVTCICTWWNESCCGRVDACKTWFHPLFHGGRWVISGEGAPVLTGATLYLLTLLPLWHSSDTRGNPRGSAFWSNIKILIDGLILLGIFMNINLSQMSCYRSGLSSQAEELTVSYLEQNKGSWTTQNKE